MKHKKIKSDYFDALDSLERLYNSYEGLSSLKGGGLDCHVKVLYSLNNIFRSDLNKLREIVIRSSEQLSDQTKHDDRIDNNDGLKQCERCSKDYIPNVTWQKFCGSECKNSQTVVKDNKNEK